MNLPSKRFFILLFLMAHFVSVANAASKVIIDTDPGVDDCVLIEERLSRSSRESRALETHTL